MKFKFLTTLVIALFNSVVFSQVSISVSTSPKDTFIEVTNNNKPDFMQSIDIDSSLFSERTSLRIGPVGLRNLKGGLNKAVKWATINESEQLNFQKEIVRLKAMDKDKFDFFGYKSEFNFDIILMFNGYRDGTFKLDVIKRGSSSLFDKVMFSVDVISDLMYIEELLDGKEIDDKINRLFN